MKDYKQHDALIIENYYTDSFIIFKIYSKKKAHIIMSPDFLYLDHSHQLRLVCLYHFRNYTKHQVQLPVNYELRF